jgi:hypothetical protein
MGGLFMHLTLKAHSSWRKEGIKVGFGPLVSFLVAWMAGCLGKILLEEKQMECNPTQC